VFHETLWRTVHFELADQALHIRWPEGCAQAQQRFGIQHPVKSKGIVAKVLCTNDNHDLHHSEPARLAARACYKLIGAATSVFVIHNYTAPPHW